MKRFASWVMLSVAGLALASCNTIANGPLPLSSPTYDKALLLLQTNFHSPDAAVRANCIEALQASRDPRAADIVEQGLHDPEWVVRFAAVMASAELRGDRAANVRPTINTMVERDPSGSVRAGCIYALKRFGDTSHMNDMAKLLDAVDYATQANSALVVGLMHDSSLIPLLQLHHEKSDIRVRFEITCALARLGDEPSQHVVAGWAVNKFAEDQWTAMMVCADLPPVVGRTPLLLGLEGMPAKMPANMSDADKATVKSLTTRRQLVAARSLARMHDAAAGYDLALTNLANPDASLRALAVLALGDMIDSRRAPGLDPLLTDPDDGVKRATAAAIVGIYARARMGAGG